MSGRLVLFVETRAILVASRLRVTMERRGYAAVPRGMPVPDDGFSIVIRNAGPAACWIHPDHPDAVPDELGQSLSHELRCRVTSLVRLDAICAYEVAEGGRLTEKMAVNGAEIVEEQTARHAAAVQGGAVLADLLTADGLDGLSISFEDAAAERRAMKLDFAPLPGRGAAQDAIEIDPGLSCPICKEAMRVIEGGYGRFYGCVRFPQCKGRLTEKQAEAARVRS